MSEQDAYERANHYLLGTISETVSPRTSYKLDRMYALLQALGDPHLAYPTIHVGGTSGKGSTSTMIAAALNAAGLRTGLHTKPHLHDATERARIGGVPIARERFASVLDGMMPAIETVAADLGRPTYYETLLALALTYFAQEHVDVAVVEVGLGGRLDGTNVLQPEVAAITSVGYDHTDVLGDTLEAIAREKAGIAKPGVPLVVAAVQPEAAAVIEACATQTGARVVRVGDWTRVEQTSSPEAFDVVTAQSRYRIRTPVAGAFQRINAATAIAVLEQLRPPLRVTPDAVERGFATLSIPGRMEIVAGAPSVVFDIAHNAEKAQHLVSALRERFDRSRVHYVVAIGESKNAADILAALAALPGTMTFTSFQTPGRIAIAPQRLAEIAASAGILGRAIEDPVEALGAAKRAAGANDVVVVTGSTFVVGTLRRQIAGQVAGIA